MQLVGQQLILECNVTITGCITSSLRADIVWSRNNVGLKRTENANVSYANNITVIYVDEYIISQVSTNEDGTQVDSGAVRVPDLFASLCFALGVDADEENYSRAGRPIRVVDDGSVIEELFI